MIGICWGRYTDWYHDPMTPSKITEPWPPAGSVQRHNAHHDLNEMSGRSFLNDCCVWTYPKIQWISMVYGRFPHQNRICVYACVPTFLTSPYLSLKHHFWIFVQDHSPTPKRRMMAPCRRCPSSEVGTATWHVWICCAKSLFLWQTCQIRGEWQKDRWPICAHLEAVVKADDIYKSNFHRNIIGKPIGLQFKENGTD